MLQRNSESVLRAFGMKVGHIFYVITSIHEYRSKPIEKDANKNDLMELRALFVRIHPASFCSIIRWWQQQQQPQQQQRQQTLHWMWKHTALYSALNECISSQRAKCAHTICSYCILYNIHCIYVVVHIYLYVYCTFIVQIEKQTDWIVPLLTLPNISNIMQAMEAEHRETSIILNIIIPT